MILQQTVPLVQLVAIFLKERNSPGSLFHHLIKALLYPHYADKSHVQQIKKAFPWLTFKRRLGRFLLPFWLHSSLLSIHRHNHSLFS